MIRTIFIVCGLVLSFFVSGCFSSASGNRGGFASTPIGSGILSTGRFLAKPFTAKPAPRPTAFDIPGTVGGGASAGQATIHQPDNPASPSSQKVDYEQHDAYVFPRDTERRTETIAPDGTKTTVIESIPAGTRLVSNVKQGTTQTIGAAQKDTTSNLTAALGSFRAVQYLGALALLAGAVGFFHPVVRVALGGKDTAKALGLAGLVMIFGPYLFVQYSNWFFLAIIGYVGYWWFGRFHYKSGQLDALNNTNSTH